VPCAEAPTTTVQRPTAKAASWKRREKRGRTFCFECMSRMRKEETGV